MRRTVKTVLFALVFALALACNPEEKKGYVPGQSHSSGEGGQSAEPDYSKLTSANHPRILLTDETVSAIKARLEAGDQGVTAMHNVIINAANGYLRAATLTHTLVGVRLLDTSDAANNQMNCLGYAWRLTGDVRYRDKAVSILETVCDFPDWNAPTHFLDAGEMAYAVGIGFDWLYSELTVEQRQKAVRALDEYAFKNAIKKKWNLNFYESATNWNQVCNGGLITGAIACYEDCAADAKAIIDKGVESNLRMGAEMYNPDGNYPEGYGYWGYGSSYQCLLLASLEYGLGTDFGFNSSIGGWGKSGKWILFMECMNRRCFNYSDCDASSDPRAPLWYMAYKFKDPSLVYLEMNKLLGGEYPSGGVNKYLPMMVSYAAQFGTGSVSAPKEHFWKGNGENPVALVHGDWSFGETDMMLGVKAGRCDYSHGHMDVGSFVFDSQGVNWSVDLGLQSYDSMASVPSNGRPTAYEQNSTRWDFFRYNNLNHSTITINGARHLVTARVPISESWDTATRRGVKLNMTSAVSDQCRSAYRTVTWENNKDVVVVDEIGALLTGSAKVRWTMVTMAVPTVLDDCIKLESKGKTLYLKTSNSLGIKANLKTWSTVGQSFDASNTGYYECGFEATVTSGKTCTFTTILTPDA